MNLRAKALYRAGSFVFYIKEIVDGLATIVSDGKVWYCLVDGLSVLKDLEELDKTKENFELLKSSLTETTQACAVGTVTDYFNGTVPIYCIYNNKIWIPEDCEGTKILKDPVTEEQVAVGFVFGGKIYEEAEEIVVGFDINGVIHYIDGDVLKPAKLVGDVLFTEEDKPIKTLPVIHSGDTVIYKGNEYIVESIDETSVVLTGESGKERVSGEFGSIKLKETQDLKEEVRMKVISLFREGSVLYGYSDKEWVILDPDAYGTEFRIVEYCKDQPVIFKDKEYTIVDRKNFGMVVLKDQSGATKEVPMSEIYPIDFFNEELQAVVPVAAATQTPVLTEEKLHEELPDNTVKPIEDYQKPIDDGKKQDIIEPAIAKKSIIFRDVLDESKMFILDNSVFKKAEDSILTNLSDNDVYVYNTGDFVKFNDIVYRLLTIDVTNGLFKLKDYFKWLYDGEAEYIDVSPLNCLPLNSEEFNKVIRESLKVTQRYDEDFAEDGVTKAMQDKEEQYKLSDIKDVPKEELREEITRDTMVAVLGEDKVALMEEGVDAPIIKYTATKNPKSSGSQVFYHGVFYTVCGDES